MSLTLGAASSTTLITYLGLTRFFAGTRQNLNAFPDVDIIALLNQKYRELQTYLLSEILYDWKENTLEGTGAGLINLVAAANNHTFPTDLATIDRIEINYTGNTNAWVVATPLKQEAIDQPLSNIANNNTIIGSKNNPIYWVRNEVIYLDPVPDVSVVGGMKVYCTIKVSDLTAATPTGTFVFPEAFHPIPCRDAAIEWLESKDKAKSDKLFQKNELKKQRMVSFYASRDQDTQVNINSKAKTSRYF